MPLVMGVDSSTQSTKVEVRDLDDGTLVATGRAPHPPVRPPRSEADPEAWWAALVAAVGAADPPPVAAVSIAGQQHGMVLVDATGAVVRPAKLWNDTESAPEATELVEAFGAAGWAEATGSVPVAAFTVTKLAWVARHEPESLGRTAAVLLPHDYLTQRLTGRCTTDRGDASGTGYFDPRTDRWRSDLLRRFVDDRAWEEHLPEVASPFEVVGEVQGSAAGELELAGAAVAPGTGDNMAAALGIGLADGEVGVSLGTSGTVFATADAPTADASGAVAGFADATGRFLPLVCTLNATKVTDSVARLLGVDEPELGALALSADAGAGGVVLVPYFDGERTPNRPDATGTVVGLRSDVTREQLARAAHEGVVCGLLEGVEALTAVTGVRPERLVVVGGGARSAAYRKIVADLSGLEALVPAGDEHVAAGACVQAAATVTGEHVSVIQARWGLRSGSAVLAPDASIDRPAIRERYRAARGDGPTASSIVR